MCAISAPPAALQRSRSSSIVSCVAKQSSHCEFLRCASAPASLQPKHEFPCDRMDDAAHRRPDLKVVNWNVAAPNNNSFEFWTSIDDERYKKLMAAVQECIDHPEHCDFEICEIFTPFMFEELKTLLSCHGVSNLEKLEQIWVSDLMNRKAIARFLKESSFGAKRLISMPDRITNSISIDGGKQIYRPSPITGSDDVIRNMADWWNLWKRYMFETALQIKGKRVPCVFSLLQKIPRSKYPALSEEEEEVSIPLQTLCLALFDGIYTHLLLKLAGEGWQHLKQSLHKALFENKASMCAGILHKQYSDADVIFIQEASEPFVIEAGRQLSDFTLLRSGGGSARCQTSLILASRSCFDETTARDLTDLLLDRLQPRCAQAGDLSLFQICSRFSAVGGSSRAPFGNVADNKERTPSAAAQRRWHLLASFHGDSDGKATMPVVAAIEALARECFPEHILVMGLDANTTSSRAGGSAGSRDTGMSAGVSSKASAFAVGAGSAGAASGGKPCSAGGECKTSELAAAAAALTVERFDSLAAGMGLGSCWRGADLESVWTTFHARTYVQPQLQKAVGLGRVMDRRNMQLKDWILFYDGQLCLERVEQDNTGTGMFVQAVMPTMTFPSDHAIVITALRRREVPCAGGGGGL